LGAQLALLWAMASPCPKKSNPADISAHGII